VFMVCSFQCAKLKAASGLFGQLLPEPRHFEKALRSSIDLLLLFCLPLT
jgi:hypothetical protein